MRACGRMSQERADLLIELGTDDVLELARMRIGFVFIHSERIGQ